MTIKETDSVNACPVCQKNDRVEKVSVIYMHGSQETTMSIPVVEINTDSNGRTYSTTRNKQVNGLNETKMAQILRPPQKPKAPGSPTHFLIYFFMIGGCTFLPSLYLSGTIITSIAKVDPSSKSLLLANVVLIFGFLLCLLFAVGISTPLASNSSKTFQKKMTEYNFVLKSWEMSIKRWNELYFCHRDGQLFIPGENVSVPLERMAEIIK